MKKAVSIVVVAAATFLTGCGGARYIDISRSAPVAVVGFSLDKSIVEAGKEPDNGPGLLQKDENFYKNHQLAINALWSDFKASYRDMLLGAEVVDVESVVSNAQYQELSKHTPQMMMGKDIAIGGNVLTVQGGLNYVSSYNKDVLEKIAAALNAKLLMCIDYTGSYAMSTGVSIGNFGAGSAKMKLTAQVNLYEPGKGVVLTRSFSEDSDESFAMVGGVLLSENYAKGFCSAQKKLLPQIKQFLQTQQTKAKESAQKK
jgi:hypothetical protein